MNRKITVTHLYFLAFLDKISNENTRVYDKSYMISMV